ncbi:hypothetical protein PG999_009415 [Apiospora kogelbergensis]|uniref:Uncharacterized protein n=1 Tax=Apiospora kogelbergensis TaxID=1337665 RepID=A0AAW0QTP8_9PEZI
MQPGHIRPKTRSQEREDRRRAKEAVRGGKGRKPNGKLASGRPADGQSSAALRTSVPWGGPYYQGKDVSVVNLAPQYKRARIGADRDASWVDDHHPDLRNRGCPRPNNFIIPINSMNRLQENRQDQITPRSLVSAMLWDQAQLPQPDIATVVNFDEVPLFQSSELSLDDFKQLMDDEWQPNEGKINSTVRIHYKELLMYMRQAEYVSWPYQFRYPQDANGDGESKGSWVLIVIRIEAIELPSGRQDRYASEIAIFDPQEADREFRRRQIKSRLMYFLSRGDIFSDRESWVADTDTRTGPARLQPGKDWATGHACYQIAHELFRRLRCILAAGRRGRYDASFWRPLEEDFNSDMARKLMLSACAQRAIEKSEYYGRLAIEFPGFANSKDAYNYQPSDLDPRTEHQKLVEQTDDGVTPITMILRRPEDIGLWSVHLDADQWLEGKWAYLQAPGEPTTTRDDRRYALSRQGK